MSLNLLSEMGQSFVDYAMSVNTDRSIPDVATGLKPVHRRILYSCYTNKYLSDKKYVKCARITGNVIGSLHPHGDTSVYDALVRLAQPWVMRYPLIDFHGNMGAITGDGPASQRYTEARLSPLAEYGMLQNVSTTVDFVPNYDETETEPIQLPAVFPNLLCNPTVGIGVTMATGFAPHNLRDITELIKLRRNGSWINNLAPDFPTGGVIINQDELPEFYETGRGSIKIRGKYHIDKKNRIIFTEIPYGVTLESLIDEIAQVATDNVIEGISDVHDETGDEGVRIVITPMFGLDPNNIVQKLFEKTRLQNYFSLNMRALDHGVPKLFSMKEVVDSYLEFNQECILRESKAEKEKVEDRLEVLTGLIRAVDIIDEIIALIKASTNTAEAKQKLQSTFDFSERQAQAILDLKLSRLAKLEHQKLIDEKQKLEQKLEWLNSLINSKDNRLDELIKRLDILTQKYGDKRRTEVRQIDPHPKNDKVKNDIIPQEVMVHISMNHEIKRIPIHKYVPQHTKTVGMRTGKEITKVAIKTNTTDYLLLFSNKGKMYKLLVDKIPETDIRSQGIDLNLLLKLQNEEIIQVAASAYHQDSDEYVVFFTKNGLVKKTLLSEYTSIKKMVGIQAIKFKDPTDSLVSVHFITDEDLMIVSHNGMTIKFNSTDIKPIGRSTAGVRGILLEEGDYVVAGLPMTPKAKYLAFVSEKGKGKRVPLKEFDVQVRGGKGLSGYKTDVVSAALIEDTDVIFISGTGTSLCIRAEEVPIQSRIAGGNFLIRTSKVTSMVVI